MSSATTTTTTEQRPKTCVCLPYKDALVITAQALSIVGLFLSWSTVISILFGLTSFIMYQVVWCCRMNRCGLITAGVFAAISGACCTIVGALVMSSGTTRWCTTTTNAIISSYGYDDDIWSSSVQQANEDSCKKAINVVSGIGFGGGIVWIACAVCTFVFVCGPRYAKFQKVTLQRDNEEDVVVPVTTTNTTAAAVAVAVPIVDVEKGQGQGRNETEKTDVMAPLEGTASATTNKKKKKKKNKTTTAPTKKKKQNDQEGEADVSAAPTSADENDDANNIVSVDDVPTTKKKKKKTKKKKTPTEETEA